MASPFVLLCACAERKAPLRVQMINKVLYHTAYAVSSGAVKCWDLTGMRQEKQSLKKSPRSGSEQFLFLLCPGSGTHSRQHPILTGEGCVREQGDMPEAVGAEPLLTC